MTEQIRLAAEALRRGDLVVIPTETVYGLACDATNERAVAKVFDAKGRPSDNPLIVHVLDWEHAASLSHDQPGYASRLAAAFWPGPLTLVLPKSDAIPGIVSGGLATVGLRAPAHPIAREVLEASGLPLAAPSANRFMALSVTRLEDLDPAIRSAAALCLDGGPCQVGIESTVLDCTGPAPRLLRPGGISRLQIEEACGLKLLDPGIGERRSPGMYPRHYAPVAPVRLVEHLEPGAAGLGFARPASERQIQMPSDPSSYAAELYAALNTIDRMGPSEIQIETPPDAPGWEAVRDRLSRAAS